MAFEDLRKEIEILNQSSDIKYIAAQKARNKISDHYNDRKIIVYFRNDGRYETKHIWIPLIEFHEHRFGSINSLLSKYMGFDHEKIFKLIIKYVMRRRSERAPITKKYWDNDFMNFN